MTQNKKWHEPFEPSEWLKRIFSCLNTVIFIGAALFIFSELRFDWCEKLTGSYLAMSNANRPETGTVWKAGKSSYRAKAHLKNIIDDRHTSARNAGEAGSFLELSSKILPGQWTHLESPHFKQLYLDLPDSYAREIIDPAELIWLFGTTDLNRILCKSKPGGIVIYFLDTGNRVIRDIELDADRLAFIEEKERPFKANLDAIPEFKNRIFPAEKFFSVLLDLPGDINHDLMINPGKLLRQPGKILRAGISEEADSGYIKMGFEFYHKGETTIVTVKGREWAVWRLSLSLTGESK
ncbi:MAG: hypothetical protein U9P10_02980 [Thermodesulfobacteriota bacterium]|nr:hypothetical protein [Thermodesulfobacteriota bacterium]